MKEAIKCLVNESPGRLPPLPTAPRAVNLYRGGGGGGVVWAGAGEGDCTGGVHGILWGARHPSGHRCLMGVRGGRTPPWCLLTFRTQAWLVASCAEEEEEEGCRRSAMNLSMLGPPSSRGLETPANSWPRSSPLLVCPQPRPSHQHPRQTLSSIPWNWPQTGRSISGTAGGDGGMQRCEGWARSRTEMAS